MKWGLTRGSHTRDYRDYVVGVLLYIGEIGDGIPFSFNSVLWLTVKKIKTNFLQISYRDEKLKQMESILQSADLDTQLMQLKRSDGE